MIQLFSNACLYENDETILYGQYLIPFRSILTNSSYKIVYCVDRNDFFLKIKGKINNITITFVYKDTSVHINESLSFPFEYGLNLNNKSAIISTLCKDYSHRLDEWIQYNLKLGFSGIVIFNNDGNQSTILNESTHNCVKTGTTEEICKKYKGKVIVVNFPYRPFKGQHWNNIQRISLHIGVNAFRTKCRNIALIDADEFIYLPIQIETFLNNHGTICMQSNILTNKNNNDLLNNNILELAKYVGIDKYTKIILDTSVIKENEFIVTPHNHRTEKKLSKNEIIHYHCWMNNRYPYHESMQMIKVKLF